VPTTTSYAAFLGGLGMVAGVFGIVTVFVHIFDGIIPLIVEGLATLLFIAGGVTMAIMVKGGQCNDFNFVATNKIINCGGTMERINGTRWWTGICGLDYYKKGEEAPPDWIKKASKLLQQRCEEATADYGLMFAIVLLSAVVLWLGFVWRRKASKVFV
jgi:Membrane-associating domain